MTKSDHSPPISVPPEVFIPEIVAEILARTSPRDACRAASISKGFNLAADSDAVWERFLPTDYHQIIAWAVRPLEYESKSKKELYHILADSYIILERGKLSFKLDKESGRKCYMKAARSLYIEWSKVTRHWKWGHVPESRFAEVAILREVWWLDILCIMHSVLLSPKTTYAAYLVFRVIRDSRGLSRPGKSTVSYSGVRNETSNVCLQLTNARDGHVYGQARDDGWMEIKLGEFYCDDGDGGDVAMKFEEHDANNVKWGLIVEGVDIRPK